MRNIWDVGICLLGYGMAWGCNGGDGEGNMFMVGKGWSKAVAVSHLRAFLLL